MSRDNFELSYDSLNSIKNEEDIKIFLYFLKSLYNLKNCVYHAIKLPGIKKPNPVIILTYDQSWISHYTKSNYFNVDPILAVAPTSVMPIDWVQLPRTSRPVRQLFGEATDFGVGSQGMTFPVRGAAGDLALFSITSDAPRRDWELLRRGYARDFQVIAHALHSKVVSFQSLDDLPQSYLTKRERECLLWTAYGRSMEETAIILSITPRAVRAHLDSARYKLGALNKNHAVAKALTLGIISIDMS